MMLKRKIEKELSRFLHDNGRYALLVTGARQVGKTFSIEQFGRENYDNFVEINFIREPEALAIFNNVSNADDVYMRLSAYANLKPRRKGQTLVFLDEIQRCPEAVTYMKFLVQRGGCHYILSGSLLGVELKDIRSVPVGFMSEVQMFPLDFEEFLWANGISEEILENAQSEFM
ncbi:MAG: AAA family ATPase, partial [Victivallales bacterium]|nr:AAA family ATPase [Victivallales bacterium]